MCFWCLHIGFSPGKPIQSRDYQYFTKLLGEKNVAPGKRHIVDQCNNNDLFNKVIISHLEAEGNKRNIRHVVKMFKTIDKKYFMIVDHCPVLDNLSLTIYPF